MRMAGVVMVKNECDIIELFLKINLRTFDFIHVIDHSSNDGTAEIIKYFQLRGFSIGYELLSDHAFNQSKVITGCVRKLAASDCFDYIVPLDADEFLSVNDSSEDVKSIISSMLDVNSFGIVPWKTYVPVCGQYYSSGFPLFENFRARKYEPVQYFKVVLGKVFAKNCVVSEGSHFAKQDSSFFTNKKISRVLSVLSKNVFSSLGSRCTSEATLPDVLPLILQHVPVRSSSQIMRKAVLGSHTLAMKHKRGKREGVHWDEMADRIRSGGFSVSDAELASIAYRYGVPREVSIDDFGVEDFPRIGLASDFIELKELSEIDLLSSFDLYISSLVESIKRR